MIKRGKMKKKCIYLILGLFLMILAIYAIADEILEVPCMDDSDCLNYADNSYCDLELEKCVLITDSSIGLEEESSENLEIPCTDDEECTTFGFDYCDLELEK